MNQPVAVAIAASGESPAPPAAQGRSRERIMDVAEVLFGQMGYEAASTRAIAVDAGVNLGTVHYHFGSKRQLFIEVFLRQGRPLVAERMRLLDEAHVRWPDGNIPLVELIRRFSLPLLRMAMRPGGGAFARLHARLMTEPPDLAENVRNLLHDQCTSRYVAAFRTALPYLPEATLYWRIYFMLGVNSYALIDSVRLKFISGGLCSSSDLDVAMRELVPFLEAGLRAPLSD